MRMICLGAMMFGLAGIAANSSSPIALAATTPAPPAANAVGCASPVGRNDSAAALMLRFRANARKETVPGAEGETAEAVVLYPRDPLRRLEVIYSDAAMLHPASVNLRAERSVWAVAGLHLGDGLEQVARRNGRAFTMSGFEWDYGGYVNDLKGGALSRLPGGCSVTIRFKPRGLDARSTDGRCEAGIKQSGVAPPAPGRGRAGAELALRLIELTAICRGRLSWAKLFTHGY